MERLECWNIGLGTAGSGLSGSGLWSKGAHFE